MPSLNITYKSSTILIGSDPEGADIFIDGKPQGQTPKRIDRILPGKRTIQVCKARFQSELVVVDVPQGETRALFVELGVSKESPFFFD